MPTSRAADEIFSTGNFSKVSPITRIDERPLQPGPFYRKARELYWEFAHGDDGRIDQRPWRRCGAHPAIARSMLRAHRRRTAAHGHVASACSRIWVSVVIGVIASGSILR